MVQNFIQQPMLIAVNLFIQPNTMNYNVYLFYSSFDYMYSSTVCKNISGWRLGMNFMNLKLVK